jgi:hypothetical protein
MIMDIKKENINCKYYGTRIIMGIAEYKRIGDMCQLTEKVCINKCNNYKADKNSGMYLFVILIVIPFILFILNKYYFHFSN